MYPYLLSTVGASATWSVKAELRTLRPKRRNGQGAQIQACDAAVYLAVERMQARLAQGRQGARQRARETAQKAEDRARSAKEGSKLTPEGKAHRRRQLWCSET